MTRRDLELGPARVLAYGHWGRPLLVFPSELGKRWDWEDSGMIGALGPLIEDGRVKVYCADGADESENGEMREGAVGHLIPPMGVGIVRGSGLTARDFVGSASADVFV